jgi:putative redox protein
VRVSARRRKGYAHSLTAGRHVVIADEPTDRGGSDAGPTPTQLLALSLASCTAITVEMYADRKGWELGAVEVDVDYELKPREAWARFEVVLKLPDDLPDEHAERLAAIAPRCPVHRTLKGEVEITDRVERIAA